MFKLKGDKTALKKMTQVGDIYEALILTTDVTNVVRMFAVSAVSAKSKD